ncbi:hypothetical protein GCM10009839_10800 [Catenulispora yoronensis]|uniref:Uncharacterized protein n=2 Tax=Catenulispora yoronensis TaxID=450799 RepID=A0ABN2TRF0_9ACTN
MGITLLIVGGYTMALGFGGVNANSGGVQWLFSIILVLGFIMTGWATVLPWDGVKGRAVDAE